jgi:hypothetical protein
MYERFISGNSVKPNTSSVFGKIIQPIDDRLAGLFAECGGASIDKGLYRVHSYSSSIRWSDIIQQYFPDLNKTILPFGYDWIGRQYCIIYGVGNVLVMFDPATMEYFKMAGDVIDFHNIDLVDDRDATVSENSFLSTISKLKISELNIDQCVGYKVPLFLGGNDDPGNYEVVNIEVYWDIQMQIYNQVKDLPPGTKINSVEFRPDD